MNFNHIKENKLHIAELISDEVVINEVQDALDMMVDAQYKGASAILIRKDHIIPDFFDLKTGIAGEILQKFSTYNVRLAIMGDFSEYKSKALKDFIFESNKLGRICFVTDIKEAIRMLS